MGLKRLFLLVVLVATAASVVLVPGAGAGNFDEERMGCIGDNPATCPTGTTGQPYSLRVYLVGDEDLGCAIFRHSSGFPPGLTLASEGVISGTPTQAGTFDFYLTADYTKEVGCQKPNSDDRFIIPINQGLAKLTLGPEQVGVGPATVGAAFALQMTATVPEAKTWSINAGALPPGLAIDASTGLISGTPMTAGEFSFEVLARMVGDSRSDTKALTVVVRDALVLAGSDPFTAARRASAEVSAPFTALITATGGTGTYTWSLSTGTLPPGLLFTDGAISGTPTTPGVYPFTVTVTDSESRVKNYPSRIAVAEKLAIATLLLPPGKVAKLYTAKLRTFAGVKPATWRIFRGPLPRGVRFDRFLGQLYGIPTRPGRYRVTFEATDFLGVKAKKTLAILVAPSATPRSG